MNTRTVAFDSGYLPRSNAMFIRIPQCSIALFAALSACNPCDLQTEVARVLSAQTSVTHCGDVRPDSSRAEVSTIVDCMTSAISERRPFRAYAGALRTGQWVYLGRYVGSSYEVRTMSYNPSPLAVESDVCAAPTFRIVVRSEGNTASLIVWDCPEHTGRSPLPPQPPYNPPSQVPIGQLCPVP